MPTDATFLLAALFIVFGAVAFIYKIYSDRDRDLPPRMGRNPKTGEAVALAGKNVPHFKPGKDLRERVNESRHLPVRD